MGRIVIIIATVILMASCVSVKKQRSRAHEFFREHPEELAEICADKFAPKTEFTPGKTIIKTDTTILTDTVTVTADCPDGTHVEVECPPNKTITIRDTIRVRDTIRMENTARVEQYRLKAEEQARMLATEKILRERAEEKAKQRGWLLLGLFLAIIFVGFIIYKR